MADAGERTDTSTDIDADERNHRLERGQTAVVAASDSSDRSKDKTGDQKTLRRLAQNREAARKSRLRKRLKLTQLEQELQRARQQGIFISSTGDQSHTISANGAKSFDIEYGRWLEEHNRQFDEIFKIKGVAAKADVFHILSGMWKTPAERCFMWLGGFRPSEILKLLSNQLEPLTEQQVMGLCDLQQSSQQAEDALSQGMEALQQSLAETLAGSLGPQDPQGTWRIHGPDGHGHGQTRDARKVPSPDNLRQQTLQQMHQRLTTRQSARAVLTIHDYFSRLRALSSLWLARPESSNQIN
uniref:Uncharacterized protein n=1 Tax=Ananas comosus var. bracteatus TaxID=296719 RepID=A0A6V7Q9X1_ANACO|nr:unnamed protein product [Ananas comosus var. bracteatus]